MGEMAEAALWAEMHGIEFSDMGPDEWEAFYKDQEPASAGLVWNEAKILLGWLDEHCEDEEPARHLVLLGMFPALALEDALKLAQGLEALASLPEPDDD